MTTAKLTASDTREAAPETAETPCPQGSQPASPNSRSAAAPPSSEAAPTLRVDYVGSHGARFEGETHRFGSGDVLPKLCRELLRRGYDRSTLIEAFRDDTPVFTGPCSIGFWADRTVEEHEQGYPRLRLLRPRRQVAAVSDPG